MTFKTINPDTVRVVRPYSLSDQFTEDVVEIPELNGEHLRVICNYCYWRVHGADIFAIGMCESVHTEICPRLIA